MKAMRDRIKMKKFFILCVDSVPMGSMFNMGSNGKRKLPFPYSAIGLKKTEEEIRAAKEKMIAYVEDQCALPKSKRAGSAKTWD